MDSKFSRFRPLTDAEEAEIQSMIASDPDAPEITEEQMAQARPFREAHPELYAKIQEAKAQGQTKPKFMPLKSPVSLRIDQDVLLRYRATGKGWQSRMNRDLRKAIGL